MAEQMKQVTTRQVQKDISKLLEDLPFEITRYGKTVATVVAPNELSVEEVKEDTDSLERFTKKVGFCQAHFEKGATYEITAVEFRDENDNVVFKGDACGRCIKTYEDTGEGEVIYTE